MKTQQELMQEVEKQIIAFTKRYKIPGFENPPFSPEECSELLKKTKGMLQQLREAIAEMKVFIYS